MPWVPENLLYRAGNKTNNKEQTTMATKAKTAAKKTTPAKGPSKADQRLAEICVALEKKGEATAKDIGVPSTYFTAAVKAGLIKVASSVKSGGRGRPAFTYKLTAKGKKVAQKNA